MGRRAAEEYGRRISKSFFSYKSLAISVCSLNLLFAALLLSSAAFSSPSGVKYTKDQIRSMEESIRVRLAAVPVELVDLAKKLKEELKEEGERRWELQAAQKWEVADEILGRLKGLGADANETQQREAVESWRSEKLEQIKRAATGNMTSNSSIPAQEAKMLEGALQSDWFNLLEDIGFWMPANVNNSEINDEPENAQELEDREIIAGPPLPPECHAELHTDYDGAAVRWGLTHHKESAADCCQACLDHAKNAKEGEKKCNIWVYCPSEFGCYSPDIYEHKHQECWLKQAEKPRLNFKEKYSEPYRNSHPKAPVVVPWMSGVIAA
ncbi:uncharacterized protein M6B38_104345 [Iris pallida]|uniref:Apple domain-containing protein n=1 Tax=Iris pallida TaxID=29817 RepID=A0AAX6F336_IRIPA|nr:uncharacterized protein M6B38_104345 [Iris pallida]